MNTEIVCLPGGEWMQSVVQALAAAGLPIQALSSRSYEYSFSNPNEKLPVRFVVTRSRDVGRNITSEELDTSGGFTGSDIALEQLSPVAWVLPLWDLVPSAPRPTISVAYTPNILDLTDSPALSDLAGSRVYTSYPRITASYFADRRIPIMIRERDGKIEAMWKLDPANKAIVDVVSSGQTLADNQLQKANPPILQPTVVFLQKPDAGRFANDVFNDLRDRLYSAARRRS